MDTSHARLETLLTALDASPLALRRDKCAEWAINGRLGHIFADGAGFLLCVTTGGSIRRWTKVKQRLGFCRVTQNGDNEGCLRLDHLPTPVEAATIRKALRIRRLRHLSSQAMAQAMGALKRARPPR